MKKLFSVKNPSTSPSGQFVVCDGPRTHVIGWDVGTKPPRSGLMTLEKAKKPVVMKLPVHAAAMHVTANGFLVVGTDLSVHEGKKTFKRLTSAALKKPLADESSLLGTMVAFASDDEAFALVPAKKAYELRRWQRGDGWTTVGAVPGLVVSDTVGCVAWDARRKRVVVLGANAKRSTSVAELDGTTWTVHPTRYTSSRADVDVRARDIVGGKAVVALPPGKPVVLLGEGILEPIYYVPSYMQAVGLADGPSLRNVRDQGSELIVESVVELEPYLRSSAPATAAKKTKRR